MPSIRIRHPKSYTSLHEEPDSSPLFPRSLVGNPFTGPVAPAGATTQPPRARPSLPVFESGEALRPRSRAGVSRVQSRVFRDSIPKPRSPAYPGYSGSRATESEFSSFPQPPERAVEAGGEAGENEESWAQFHHDDIVEHLDVIDPQVGTVSTLANAANAIIIPPSSFYNRKPTIVLPVSSPNAAVANSYEDGLDRHVDDVIRRPFPMRRTLLGVWAFLKTPMGIITGIYGFLVVFWGAAIVIFLARIINLHNEDLQGFWIEVSSQVVNGLFTATSIGLIPSRVVDTYRIYKIWHYKRKTIQLRRKAGLSQLFDLDDLPDPCYDDNYVRVLTDQEQHDLHRQQMKFQYHQTWYRAHGSETHRAFPINVALLICLLNDANSMFQIILCGTMWGLNRFERPAWSTGTLIPMSFLCGIGAAILIWRGGEKTKRVEEIRQKLRAALAELPQLTVEHPLDSHPTEIQTQKTSGTNSATKRPELLGDIDSSSEKPTQRNIDSMPCHLRQEKT